MPSDAASSPSSSRSPGRKRPAKSACRRLAYALSESVRWPLLSRRAFATRPLLARGDGVRPEARLELLAEELVETFLTVALDGVTPLELVRLRQEPVERDVERHLLHDLERFF